MSPTPAGVKMLRTTPNSGFNLLESSTYRKLMSRPARLALSLLQAAAGFQQPSDPEAGSARGSAA